MNVTNKISEAEFERQFREELLAANRKLGIEQTLEYIRDYGHLFVLEDEDVTQSIAHQAAIRYLVPLLEWLFEGQDVVVVEDFRFYLSGIEGSSVGPDIAIVDSFIIDTSNPQKSFEVGIDGPPPRVVFEFASERTWDKDVLITEKLGKYERMQVQEYFVFDPNPEQVWEGEWLQRGRLVGWRLNPKTQTYTELKKDRQGRFKSEQLNSWLKVEAVTSRGTRGYWLRLYDLEGNLRLSKAEAADLRANFSQAKTDQLEAALLEESRRVEQAETVLAAERQRAEVERQRADAERQRAEQAETVLAAERQRIQELENLLRQLKDKSEQ